MGFTGFLGWGGASPGPGPGSLQQRSAAEIFHSPRGLLDGCAEVTWRPWLAYAVAVLARETGAEQQARPGRSCRLAGTTAAAAKIWSLVSV